MSKMVDTQVEKTQNLIDGIRKNLDVLRPYGYTEEKIYSFECEMNKLKGFATELDDLLAEVSAKRMMVNTALAKLKENYNELKLPIKSTFPVYDWINYGIADKK